MLRNAFFCCTICIFWNQAKKCFCFFGATLNNFRYKKQLLIDF